MASSHTFLVISRHDNAILVARACVAAHSAGAYTHSRSGHSDVGFSFRIDKIVHFFLFGIQMVLTAYALEKHTLLEGVPARPILISAIFSIAAGIGIEFLQRFVPGRSFSVLDMVANTIGVGIGYYVFRYLKKRNRL